MHIDIITMLTSFRVLHLVAINRPRKEQRNKLMLACRHVGCRDRAELSRGSHWEHVSETIGKQHSVSLYKVGAYTMFDTGTCMNMHEEDSTRERGSVQIIIRAYVSSFVFNQ